MPPSTSSHRPKRAFLSANQSSLDTFLGPSSTPNTRSPVVLPANIQSNLLSVGMRVRKSVPEGYKTHKLGFHEVRSATIRLPGQAEGHGEEERKSVVGEEGQGVGYVRELQPYGYCGLHSTGGHSAQTYTNAYTPIDASAFDTSLDFDETPFSSQSSSLSTESAPARHPLQPSFTNLNTLTAARASKGKRGLEEEDEEVVDSSPLSGFVTGPLTFGQQTTRAVAVPRSRRRRSPRLAARQTTLTQYLAPPPEAVPDFEEAVFFKEDEWRENAMDVENNL